MKLVDHEKEVQYLILNNVRRHIQIQGMKQEVLADKLGIRQSHLSEKLRGKSGLQLHFLIRLCKVLKIPLSELIGLSEVDAKILRD